MGKENRIDCNAPQITMRIGKTTYVIGMNFNKETQETIDDKIRKIIRGEIKKSETA